MHISRQKIDDLNSVITIELKKDDYLDQVDKSIREQSKKAKLPGFRNGMVPAAHIKKVYGKSILVDQVNSLLSQTLNKYIEENHIQILGQPLPSTTDAEPKWDFSDDFVFKYELGTAPEFMLDFSKSDHVTAYDIVPDEATLESRTKNLRRAYGKMSNPALAEDGDILFSEFVQLDQAGADFPGGIHVNGSLKTELVTEPVQKQQVLGLKAGDTLVLDLTTLLSGNTKALAALLKIDEALAADMRSPFRLTVKNINRLEEADLDQEFYDKVFPEDHLSTPDEFKQRVIREIAMMTAPQAAQKLDADVVTWLTSRFTAELPDEFLKRWLQAANQGKFDTVEIEAQYAGFRENLKWTLIESKILKEAGIETGPQEMIELAKEKIALQYRMYSQTPLEEAQLSQYAIQMLQDREQSAQLFEELRGRKAIDHVISQISIDRREIPYNEFLELVKTEQK